MSASAPLNVLLSALGPDAERSAHAYRLLHARLARLFSLNNAADPAALADETLDRLARSLSTRQVDSPVAFALGIARLLLKEEARRRAREHDAARDWTAFADRGEAAEREALLARMEACLERMDPGRREMLHAYYAWSGGAKIEHHRQMAGQLGLSVHALRNRLLRARDDLAACVGSDRKKRADRDVSTETGTPHKVQDRPRGDK